MRKDVVVAFVGGLLAALLMSLWVIGPGRLLASRAPVTDAPGTAQQSSVPQGAEPVVAELDVPVLDQDGKRLNFYSDLVRGRTVAIQFVYTTCTTYLFAAGRRISAWSSRISRARIGADLRFDLDLDRSGNGHAGQAQGLRRPVRCAARAGPSSPARCRISRGWRESSASRWAIPSIMFRWC